MLLRSALLRRRPCTHSSIIARTRRAVLASTPTLRPGHLTASTSAAVLTCHVRPDSKASFSTSTTRHAKKDSDHEPADPSQETKSKGEAKDKPAKRRSAKGPESEEAAEPVVEEAVSKKEGGQAPPSEDQPNNAAATAAGGLGPASSTGTSSGGDGGSGKKSRKSAEKSLQKAMVPGVYPQVLAIPITKRPLFPGFYKAVTIKDPNVAQAIAEMLKCGQPYIGAFLAKNEDDDADVIRNVEDVHDVGVFAQITSALPVRGQDGALTAIIYPHRRIRLSSLVKSGVKAPDEESTEVVEVPEPISSKPSEEDQTRGKVSELKGDVVASFEEGAVQEKPARKQQQYGPVSFLRRYPVSLVNVENLVDKDYDPKSAFIRAVTSEIVNVFKEVARMNPLFRDQVAALATSQSTGNLTAEPGRLADLAAIVSLGDQSELQEILACLDVEERLQKGLTVLKKDLMNAELQSRITKDVETKINKRQREYWLMEHMKGIRRELGLESDGKDKLVEKFKAKADLLAMPEAVRKVFDEEINKLAHLETAASEFNVTRNYLDWLTQIPWGLRSTENFNIQNATKVLNDDHYGLEDVKDRILEFIAVGKLRGTVEGKILCFVGPPGVGKTSIGKSIARALNRQYYRFSVGGLTDVAEIKGHRRTYVGALPGRIIQALKKCQTENPLILIDEVDKIGRGWQGDPSSSLLELLDPEQNGSFLDHYMDVPVDLSRVLFVCTANMTDTIPQPLLDRMEIISLSGYVSHDKMKIAEKYLAPAAKETAGLKNADVNLTNEAIEELIRSYCRESGVRNLKKQIEKVFRKSALKIVKELGEEALPEEAALTSEGKEALRKSAPAVVDDKVPNDEVKRSPQSSTDVSERETTHIPRVALEVPASVHIEIGSDNLKDYVGPPVFTSDRLYDVNPAGVAMGLAWTQMGGAAMYVESILKTPLRPGTRPELDITGNLKKVMKESSSIAYSFARSLMAKNFPDNHFFDRAKLHLHVPDGAVPKDGPSAGITMATSLLSLALDAPVNPVLAMTGELTLTGKVLRIGGLREKTVAARRVGCSTIVFPKDNMSDWIELPENIREGIQGWPVDWYSEVFDFIFPDLDREQANKCKTCQWKQDNEQKGGSTWREKSKSQGNEDDE